MEGYENQAISEKCFCFSLACLKFEPSLITFLTAICTTVTEKQMLQIYIHVSVFHIITSVDWLFIFIFNFGIYLSL